MKLGELNRTHEDYAEDTWERYDHLFRGGDAFRESIGKYLPQNAMETRGAWNRRTDQAYYTNHAGPIGTNFAAMLFASPPIISFDPEQGPDSDYARFKEDCDGHGTDVEAFFRDRFVEAMIKGQSFWRIDFGSETVTADERLNVTVGDVLARMAQPTLYSLCPEQITNWRCDERGEYEWLVEHQRSEGLLRFSDADVTVTETWTLWEPTGATRWQVSYYRDRPLSDDFVVPEIDAPRSFGIIPVKRLVLPDHLWLMNVVGDTALEHFRVQNALSYLQRMAAYTMPVFNVKNKQRPPKMGTGYYVMIGLEEKMQWSGPPTDPMKALEERLSVLKDELYRVATQMARGVDNNAAAIGRSGLSKQADASATERVLAAYGEIVCEALEDTLQTISAARNDGLKISVKGMDAYDLADAATLIANAATTQTFGIPSKQYRIEKYKKIVRAELSHLSEESMKTIDQEIEAGVTDEPEVGSTMNLGIMAAQAARATRPTPSLPAPKTPALPPRKPDSPTQPTR